jgi:hypothetical protein
MSVDWALAMRPEVPESAKFREASLAWTLLF